MVVSVVVVVVCIKLGYTELIFCVNERRRIFAFCARLFEKRIGRRRAKKKSSTKRKYLSEAIFSPQLFFRFSLNTDQKKVKKKCDRKHFAFLFNRTSSVRVFYRANEFVLTTNNAFLE